ncbi:hypothetical protein HanIR_Chr17g0871851 [Helianthus annuus]|nr:hypothetical protein HanIR_Chr17g0871851 [Helianthus annuus]
MLFVSTEKEVHPDSIQTVLNSNSNSNFITFHSFQIQLFLQARIALLWLKVITY